MSRWLQMRNVGTATAGLVGGFAVYLSLHKKDFFIHNVFTSWTTNTIVPPEARWDYNWDQ